MPPSTLLPLAQRDTWESLGNRFSGEHARFNPADLIWLAVIAAVAVVGLWWLAALSKRIEGRSSRPQPWRLFRELCARHSLTRDERSLLKKIAERTGLDQPAVLFVREDLFKDDHINGDHLADEQQALGELRQKLFSA